MADFLFVHNIGKICYVKIKHENSQMIANA